MIKNIIYHIDKKHVLKEIEEEDIPTGKKVYHFNRNNFLQKNDELNFYEDYNGDWWFESKNKEWIKYPFIYIDDSMRDHCYIDEDEVIKKYSENLKKIDALKEENRQLVEEADLEDIVF